MNSEKFSTYVGSYTEKALLDEWMVSAPVKLFVTFWFQFIYLNGGSCEAPETITLLGHIFGDRIISMNWGCKLVP